MAEYLTLAEAEARFGPLLDPATRTHRMLDDGLWIWRPEYLSRKEVRYRRYRRYPQPRPELKVTWRGR